MPCRSVFKKPLSLGRQPSTMAYSFLATLHEAHIPSSCVAAEAPVPV
jgi:hypothetical protein